jgi:hypothetical protein
MAQQVEVGWSEIGWLRRVNTSGQFYPIIVGSESEYHMTLQEDWAGAPLYNAHIVWLPTDMTSSCNNYSDKLGIGGIGSWGGSS